MSLAKIAKSVTVIIADDIARASSNSIAGLLSREANLNIRSVTGNDKFTGIDINNVFRARQLNTRTITSRDLLDSICFRVVASQQART